MTRQRRPLGIRAWWISWVDRNPEAGEGDAGLFLALIGLVLALTGFLASVDVGLANENGSNPESSLIWGKWFYYGKYGSITSVLLSYTAWTCALSLLLIGLTWVASRGFRSRPFHRWMYSRFKAKLATKVAKTMPAPSVSGRKLRKSRRLHAKRLAHLRLAKVCESPDQFRDLLQELQLRRWAVEFVREHAVTDQELLPTRNGFA